MAGENFLVELDGEVAKRGFFQNVSLDAVSQKNAEREAVQQIRSDAELHYITRNTTEDPPRVLVEELSETERPVGNGTALSGRSWFTED